LDSSRKGVLTRFQSDLLGRLSERLPAFFLTGGSALGEFYLGHRASEDLDLFTDDAQAFDEADFVVRQVCSELGLDLVAARTAPAFRRYVASRGDQQVVLDLVLDPVAQIDPAKLVIDGIRVDTLREIAVNKVCAMLGRWEPRDLVDLFFITRAGIDPLDLLPEARGKDGGLTPASLAFALRTSPPLQLPHGMLAEVTLAELIEFRDRLIGEFVRLAEP